LGRRLVISRTTLMTLFLLPPTSVKVTVKSVFSSAGAAAPPPAPAGIAIGIAEAADTPSSDSSVFTSCESSRTVIPLMYSTTCCCVTSAILVSLFLYFALGPHPQRLCLRGSSPLGLACHDFPLKAPFYRRARRGFSAMSFSALSAFSAVNGSSPALSDLLTLLGLLTALLLQLHQHAHQIARRSVQHAHDLHHRRLQHV